MITLLTVFDTGLWFDVIFISDASSGTGQIYFFFAEDINLQNILKPYCDKFCTTIDICMASNKKSNNVLL